MGLFEKIKNKMNKTRDNISSKINNVIKSFRKIDEDFFDELEEALILSDIGVNTTTKIIEELKDATREKKISDPNEIKQLLRDILSDFMSDSDLNLTSPAVILVVGVNGVGKTTAIGKLTAYYKAKGKKVILAAGDTFRAAASEQLSIWADKTDTRVVKYSEGADPAAVVFDAIDAAKHANADILIIDTAGRLHNKKNLMSELEKINRVINKEYSEAQKETFLVVDATTGQNAISQTELFNDSVDLTGIILTKLDGTAKGGVVCAVKDITKIPVRFIGIGEGIDDLQPFDAKDFAKAIIE